MKTRYLLSILLLTVMFGLSLSACGGEGGGDGNTGGETPTVVFGPKNTVARFDFENTSSEDICHLYLSLVSANSWGPDQLQGQTIAANKSFTLRNIPVGLYDVSAVGCDGGEQRLQVDIKH